MLWLRASRSLALLLTPAKAARPVFFLGRAGKPFGRVVSARRPLLARAPPPPLRPSTPAGRLPRAAGRAAQVPDCALPALEHLPLPLPQDRWAGLSLLPFLLFFTFFPGGFFSGWAGAARAPIWVHTQWRRLPGLGGGEQGASLVQRCLLPAARRRSAPLWPPADPLGHINAPRANCCHAPPSPCSPPRPVLSAGQQASGVLLGMQVPDAEREEFNAAVRREGGRAGGRAGARLLP